jgi:hypothetical protein
MHGYALLGIIMRRQEMHYFRQIRAVPCIRMT